MVYTRENEIINILQGVKNNPLTAMGCVAQAILDGGHPYTCDLLQFTIDGARPPEFSYYLTSTDPQYDDISGVMSV